MFATERMSKISITGTNTVKERVIKELHKLKALHIIDHQKTQQADIGMPLKKADDISETLVLTRGLITNLQLDKKKEPSHEKFKHFIEKNKLESYSKCKATIKELHQHILEKNEERRKSEERVKVLEENKSSKV